MCKLKKAFTMIELVIIIVVVGILAAIAMPKFDRNALLEASDQIVSHIRYTQHLAMRQNVFDPSDSNWYKGRWTVSFNKLDIPTLGGSKWRYSVYRDMAGGKTGNLNSNTEVAMNPSNSSKYLSAGWTHTSMSADDFSKVSKELNLEDKFGVKDIVLTGGCSAGSSVSFDNKGRPYRAISTTGGGGATNPADRMITSDCKIILVNDGPTANAENQAVITITPETGYARITWYPGCENTTEQPKKCEKPDDRAI